MAPRSYIFSMFGSSPVRPLQQHMGEVLSCVTELLPLFNAAFEQDWEKAETYRASISKIESEADALKHQLRLHLPKGMMMAMSRRDLLEVLTAQDRIANKAKDIAGLIVGRKMIFPGEISSIVLELIKRSVDATEQANTTINELDELVATGFGGREIDLVESMVQKLDSIEEDTDRLQRECLDVLFLIEKELPPVDVIFLYKIIDWISDLADRAQRVGSRFELMLAR